MAAVLLFALPMGSLAQTQTSPAVKAKKKHVVRKVLIVTAIIGAAVLSGMAGAFHD